MNYMETMVGKALMPMLSNKQITLALLPYDFARKSFYLISILGLVNCIAILSISIMLYFQSKKEGNMNTILVAKSRVGLSGSIVLFFIFVFILRVSEYLL